MASEEELRKINVRSPYFVNVAKPISDGGVESDDTGGGEEPFTEPTDPVVETTTLSCGDTRNIGVTIGVHRYEISTVGKQIGDYDIDFTKITVPFYAKIGIKGNMPSTYTFMQGWINHDQVWLNAVGTATPSSTTIATNPSGNDQTITYTSTQSDIDTYGETVLLELFYPVLHLGSVDFTANCPNAVVSATEAAGQQSVLIMSIINMNVDVSFDSPIPNKFNGVAADWLTMPEIGTMKSYVFGVHTPNLAPFDLNTKHVTDADTLFWNDSDHTVVYRPSNSLNKITNVIEMNQRSGDNDSQGTYSLSFSTHRIELFTGSGRSNDEAFVTYASNPLNTTINDVSRLSVQLWGRPDIMVMNTKGYETQQTFTVNQLGITESSTATNYLDSGTTLLKRFDLYNGQPLQVMNQTFDLKGYADKENR